LSYDTPSSHDEAFSKIVFVLSDVWKNQYIKHLNEPFGRVLSGDRLLERFDSWTRSGDTFTLILGPYLIWQGREASEKDKLLEVIKHTVVHPTILKKLDLLETSKHNLETSIVEIAKEATKLSKAIEAEAYSKKEDCCPTFFKLVHNYFF
jgi:hypothetical protein